MTQLDEKDRQAQMADMRSFDEQMPCVGIFWYDPEDHTLFGVRKKELTPQEVEEAAEKGVFFIEYGESKAEEFAGRIVWNKDKFVVHVGKWAESVQEELTRLVEAEFSLPYFEFEYDEEFESKYR